MSKTFKVYATGRVTLCVTVVAEDEEAAQILAEQKVRKIRLGDRGGFIIPPGEGITAAWNGIDSVTWDGTDEMP
jgi:hypothetical protein